MTKRNLLVVVAHPDDEILGVGGTLLKFSKEGSTKIHILFLSHGEASRGKVGAHERLRKTQARTVCKKIGATIYQSENFPDNSFDAVPLLRIVQAVESCLRKIKPTVVFTHHSQDLNIDHRLTFQAVYTAVRPLRYTYLEKLYSFEVLSSTEWQAKAASTVFLPTLYADIEQVIEEKIKLFQIYERELAPFPFPRSAEGIRTLARFRGMESGLKYAEAFQLVREIQR